MSEFDGLCPTMRAELADLTFRCVATFARCEWGYYCIAFSPDGRWFAAGLPGVKLWDLTAQRKVSTLTGHTDVVWSLAFSPDGRWLASGSSQEAILWHLKARRRRATLTVPTPRVNSMAFSPDGRLLALAVLDGKLLLWDVVARRTVATLIAKAVGSVAFSPDGCWLAAGRGDGKLELWDVAARQAVAALGEGEPGGVWGVAFSPDGRWLASGKGYTVKLWDMETQRGVATLTEHTWPIISVAFSPDGRWLASGSLDGTIKLWDVKAWQEAVTLVGHTEAVNSVAFSSDSRWLASASIDADNPGAHGLKLWELPPAVPSHAGSDRPPQEEVKWWREAGYCEVCGRPLGFLGKLLRRVQCRRCR